MAAQETPRTPKPDARDADRQALEERFARLTARVEELERRLFEVEGAVTPPVSE
jgi:hypothetical protein